MASAFGHAAAAIAGSKLFGGLLNWKVILLGVVCSILPDVDVLSFRFGIPYEHWLGHRGVTHSILFALVLAIILSTIISRKRNKHWTALFIFFFFCTMSHGLLDGMTTGGRGVGYFIPFDNSRYFLPWRKIQVSPLGISNFFSSWGLKVIRSEMIWIGIPSLMIYGIGMMFGNKKTHKA